MSEKFGQGLVIEMAKKSAFVMGKINNIKKTEALERLWQLGYVEDVHLTVGLYDFVAKVTFDNFESFFDAYLQVKRIPEITPQKVLIAQGPVLA